MQKYTHLSLAERITIESLLKAGHQPSFIALQLSRHQSTLSKEFKRNGKAEKYCAFTAHNKSQIRQRLKVKKRITASLWETVKSLLVLEWSPEQICGFLRKKGRACPCLQSIYNFIYRLKSRGENLCKHLRHRGKKRRKGESSQGQLEGRISIDERPKVVDNKERRGDIELDTVLGRNRKEALVTAVCRKTKRLWMGKVERHTGLNVALKLINLFEIERANIHTFTSDNGKEFSHHKNIAKRLDVDFYFAHPYASWERGVNENTNGLIRQYFPKKMSLKNVTQADIDEVVNKLNNRPRKTLEYRTPNQAWETCTYD